MLRLLLGRLFFIALLPKTLGEIIFSSDHYAYVKFQVVSISIDLDEN